VISVEPDMNKSDALTFTMEPKGALLEAGRIARVSPEVVNGKFNLAVVFENRSLFQITGLNCDGRLRPQKVGTDAFRALWVNSPVSEEAVVSDGLPGSLVIEKSGDGKVTLTVAVTLQSAGGRVRVSGKITVPGNYPENRPRIPDTER
jgi:hypothetical protein